MAKLINRKQLEEKRGGRSRTSIYRDIEAGLLPKPIKIGRLNYWVEDEIDASIEAQAVLAQEAV